MNDKNYEDLFRCDIDILSNVGQISERFQCFRLTGFSASDFFSFTSTGTLDVVIGMTDIQYFMVEMLATS